MTPDSDTPRFLARTTSPPTEANTCTREPAAVEERHTRTRPEPVPHTSASRKPRQEQAQRTTAAADIAEADTVAADTAEAGIATGPAVGTAAVEVDTPAAAEVAPPVISAAVADPAEHRCRR